MMNVFTLISGTRQGCLLQLFQFNIVPGVLTRWIKLEQRIKEIYIGEEVRLLLFMYDIIVYVEDPMESTKKKKALTLWILNMGTVNVISGLSKEFKCNDSNIWNSGVFLNELSLGEKVTIILDKRCCYKVH